MKLKLNRATISKIVRVFVQDTSKTDGSGLVGLTFASAGLAAFYSREGDVTATVLPLVTTTPGVWVSGGFVALDAVNLPGIYELGLPNAALASGNSVVAMLKGAATMAVVLLEIELDAVNYQDGIHAGLTALPNAVAGANNGLPIGDASGRVVLQPTGLDAISIADVTNDANARSTFPKMVRALFNRFYNQVTQTATTQIVTNDAGTAISTLTTSDNGTTATKGKSS